MKIPGDSIIALLSNAQNNVLIVAPFVQPESLSRLLETIPHNTEIVVVTRWRPTDLIAGVSDLKIYDVAKKRAAKLYLRNDLHAKLFAADNHCLVGSVNVTQTGLGWRNSSNFELLTPVSRTAGHIVEFEKALLAGTVQATATIRDCLQEMIESLSVLTKVESIKQVERMAEGMLPPSWIPLIRNPDELYSAYLGSKDVSRTALKTMQEELTQLATASGMNEVEFKAWVAASIIQTPLVAEVMRCIDQKGQVTEDALNDLLAKIGIDVERYRSRELLEVLERWLTYFLPSKYETARDSVKLIRANNV